MGGKVQETTTKTRRRLIFEQRAFHFNILFLYVILIKFENKLITFEH